MAEPIAVTNVLSELDTQWDASNVAEPQIIEMNGGPTTPVRIDLNRGDYLIGQPGSPTVSEIPLGNWTYVNRIYAVSLEITTKNGRQRLYDLMGEVRRICHSRRHSMTNFHRLQFVSFEEIIDDEELNVWVGAIEVQLVNTNILAET
jgi:hypothetical protein|tara:strand:- start:141 stop:581 length:441 start_codon:yes stop_codon:yes gene_type:complete